MFTRVKLLGATYTDVTLSVYDFTDNDREIPASSLANPGKYIIAKLSSKTMANHWYEIAFGYSWVAPATADNVIFVRRKDGDSYTAWKQISTTTVS